MPIDELRRLRRRLGVLYIAGLMDEVGQTELRDCIEDLDVAIAGLE